MQRYPVHFSQLQKYKRKIRFHHDNYLKYLFSNLSTESHIIYNTSSLSSSRSACYFQLSICSSSPVAPRQYFVYYDFNYNRYAPKQSSNSRLPLQDNSSKSNSKPSTLLQTGLQTQRKNLHQPLESENPRVRDVLVITMAKGVAMVNRGR